MHTKRSLDKAQWQRLSPLLDELLDLDDAARAGRLSALRRDDVALADEAQALLARLPELDRDAFLERSPLQREAGLAGQTIGAYTIERTLGQGGMGSVWLARRTDGRYEGQVALKFLNVSMLGRGGAERFAREGNILARLSHPNIARLLDAGVAHDGLQPYLVLEYIAGVPIDRYCDDHGLDTAARVRLFLDVLAAVAHAHNRLTLHRDLKPSNILVTPAGEVKLLDFGIAKLIDEAGQPAAETEITQAAGRAYTAQYAAPEQLQGGDVSTATDVYALGVLLYLLLGGSHPTAGSTTAPVDQMRAVLETEPKRLSDAVLRRDAPGAARRARELRGDLDNIVARALKKAPAQRYANAAAFADDLRRYLQHEPVAARADAPAYVLAKFVRRHRAGVAAGALVACALAAGIGVALWQAHEAQRQQVQAEGLIEFMLGDLRKKLQPVGRLEVLDAVGVKALAYYDLQEAGRLDADSLGRRARALHLIGEIAEQRGNLDEALRVFQRAADSTGELVARYPHDGQRIFDHAQSVYWVGYVARRRGQVAQAEAAFSRYADLALQLVQLNASNLDWRVELAFARQNLGVVYLESARFSQALRAFIDTRDAWLGLIDAKPEQRSELANTLGWIAKAREALGQFDGALDAQRDKIDVLLKLPDADTNRRVQRLVAIANGEMGRLQLALGRSAAAALSAQHSLTQLEALVASDATNTEWLAQMTLARLIFAETLLARGERSVARSHLDRARIDVGRLRSTDGTRSKWNIALHGSLLLHALTLPDSAAALRSELQAYVESIASVESAGKALDAEQVRIASAAQLALGDLLARDAQSAAANAHWHAAAERLQHSATAGSLAAMTLLAQAHLRLGANQDARVLAARIEASSYRHPSYADLRRQLDAAAGAAPAQ